MLSVPIIRPVLKISVSILVIYQNPVAKVLNVKRPLTDRYVDAHQTGLAIRTKSAFNVGFSP